MKTNPQTKAGIFMLMSFYRQKQDFFDLACTKQKNDA